MTMTDSLTLSDTFTPPTDPTDLADWLEDRSAGLARLVSGVLVPAVTDAVRRFSNSLTAAGDPAVFDAIHWIWMGALQGEVGGYTATMFTSGALGVYVQAPTSTGIPFSFAQAWASVVNEEALIYQAAATNRLVGVGDAVWQDVRASVVDAVASGATNEDLLASIQDITGFTEFRADTIGRTETIAAYNGGDMAGARALDEFGPVEKEWMAESGPRTRESHADANGQTVPLDSPFMVGGYAMDRPHDPSAPAEEVVNCRCSVGFLYPGDRRADGSIVPDANPLD